MLFLFLLLGSKSRLDASHYSGSQEAGLYPETVPSPLPKFQSQKAQLVRDQGLPAQRWGSSFPGPQKPMRGFFRCG